MSTWPRNQQTSIAAGPAIHPRGWGPTTVPSPSVSSVTLRSATVDDAGALREIYNHEVLTATSTFDLVTRSLAQQEEWITARSGAFSAIVAVDGPAHGWPV